MAPVQLLIEPINVQVLPPLPVDGDPSHNGPFPATLAGDALTLATGGATYTLTRPPANPLAAAADPAAPAVDATLLASTTTGRAVFLNWPRAHSAADALRATVPLLPKVVGGSATVMLMLAGRWNPFVLLYGALALALAAGIWLPVGH